MKIKFLSISFFLLSMFNGCAAVQPWERESLADPIMIMDGDPVDSGIRQHPIDNREGSAGATGSQSGGCGCG